MRCGTALLVVAMMFALLACSESVRTPAVSTPTAAPTAITTAPAQPRLARNLEQLARDLVADELALRDPASSEAVLWAAARRQQATYRALARHPDWDAVARPLIPPSLEFAYGRNVDARVQLDALGGEHLRDTLPAWRIEPPPPEQELLGYYHDAQTDIGVGWNYLAAINLIETMFGRISGRSDAGAHGPMQFLPATFAEYGNGGDVTSAHDSIMAAARMLAANGFDDDSDGAIYRYNNSDLYVRAVTDYAEVLAADPAAFAGYYRWDVYYRTTAGDVLLPVGYVATSPTPAAGYLATHPQ